jgi:hypothetical protein
LVKIILREIRASTNKIIAAGKNKTKMIKSGSFQTDVILKNRREYVKKGFGNY